MVDADTVSETSDTNPSFFWNCRRESSTYHCLSSRGLCLHFWTKCGSAHLLASISCSNPVSGKLVLIEYTAILRRRFGCTTSIGNRPIPKLLPVQSTTRYATSMSQAGLAPWSHSQCMSGRRERVACVVEVLTKIKLSGRSPQANCTDRATAACRRS
jgi:hypothetical protein